MISRIKVLLQIACRTLFFGFAFLLAPTLTYGSDSDALESILSEESLPGLVWSTVSGSSVKAGASGFSELANAEPMHELTKVQVGSVTKTLIASGVLHLVSTQKLNLETNVAGLLPELNWDNPWQGTSPVTVQHLLEHTAGLDNIRMWQFLNASVTPDTPVSHAFPSSNRALLRIRTEPGTQYSYSNMGYALLGLVIERISGERYEDYLAKELLQPLGMHDSSFHFITQEHDSRLAMGYLDDARPQKSVALLLRPAGQFTTTAPDMAKFLAFLLGDGLIGGRIFVHREYLSKLGSPSSTDAALSGLAIGHGLVLAMRDRHGVLGECHPGTTFGFQAFMCVFREQGRAFFYAVNADSEKADYERLTRYFIDQLNIAAEPRLDSISTDELRSFAGLYELSPPNMDQFAWLDWMFNSVWIDVDEAAGVLDMRSLQDSNRALLPLGDGLFRDADRRIASHVFYGGHNQYLSNGLTTWRKASVFKLGIAWLSLILGVAGLLSIFIQGCWLLLTGGAKTNLVIVLPWANLTVFTLPAYLYSQQSFLQFGEPTLASWLLAAVSALLPMTLLVAAYGAYKNGSLGSINGIAVIAGLQLCLFLVLQDVLPLVFWR